MTEPALPAVPWNAGWTSEERFEVRPCRYAGGKRALWQPHSPGVGRPIFAKPHFVRQRRSIAEMRCTVCGERTVSGDRWHFEMGERAFVDGIWLRAGPEAPVHERCAHYARRVCPHLRHLGREPVRFPLGFRILAVLVGGPAVLADFGVDIPIANPAVGHLKLAW